LVPYSLQPWSGWPSTRGPSGGFRPGPSIRICRSACARRRTLLPLSGRADESAVSQQPFHHQLWLPAHRGPAHRWCCGV
jgi:hypothetical protein